MADQQGYKNIFKSTFLFGFVQIFNIIIKVGLNKAVAYILGPTGLGIISMFNTTIHLISTAGGLGINQSAVRDISEARGNGDEGKLNLTITFTNRIIRYTSLFGVILMAALSPLLSEYTFGNKDYTIAYLLLSIAVGATIQTNGYRAINTGMRQLRFMAYSTMWGSVFGLFSALPLYYLFGENGIVPSLIISSITALVIARYYANKIKYNRIKMTIREVIKRSTNMIKMGVALMLMSFILSISQLIIAAYIRSNSSIEVVGIYQAGATIITSYFGIIITAMSTEYYPRISSFHADNKKLMDAVNAQSEIGLILALPLVVAFTLLAPFFVQFLYTNKFLSATQYIDFAVLGTLAIICSNCMGMILLAKQNSKLFLTSSLIINIIVLLITLLLYRWFNLRGLGIAYMVNGLLQFFLYDYIMRRKYKIGFSKLIYFTLFIACICALASAYIRTIEINWIKWIVGFILFAICCTFSALQCKKRLGINPIAWLKAKIKR